MTALRLEHVVKRFGDFTAVDDLGFTVDQGEIFGFLGGNGAGKTTSLRMVLDIIRPTSGTIEVLGHPPGRRNAPAVGFLPEERGLYREMTAIETIIYFGQLKRMKKRDARSRGLDLLERFDLGAWAHKPIEKLSKGMAQKVQLAAALVNNPRLLILDEPFSGLDPVNQGLLESVIVEMKKGGATVVFSTHTMQHAERLCDRLLMLAHGRKVFEGTQDEAHAALPPRLIMGARTDPSLLPGVAAAKRLHIEAEWGEWDVTLSPGTTPSMLLQYCTENRFALRRFDIHRASLHDVFLHHVGARDGVTAGDGK
jgi:ABC-2 type transport system ATP-binding protein